MLKSVLTDRYTDCMSNQRFLIVLCLTALIGLSGCQVRFKATEVEYEGSVKDTTYKLDGFALYNPFKPELSKNNLALGD